MIHVLDLRDTTVVCGPGKTILETAAAIDPLRFKTTVGVFMGRGSARNAYYDEAVRRSVRIVPLRASGPFDPSVVRDIVRCVESARVDILHAHDYRGDLLAYVAARFVDVAVVTTLHGWIRNTWKSRAYIAAQGLVLPTFDRVIAVSSRIRREAIRLGVAEARLDLVHNAIVVENYRPDRLRRIAFRVAHGFQDHDRLIGNVGRLSREKGQADFLRAGAALARRRPSVRLVLAGDGPDRDALGRLAQELGIADRVRFLGHVPDMRPVYDGIDVLALTSYTEGLPNVLLEAACMGKPVLATDVGGSAEIVQHEVNGLLVRPGRVDAIEAGLARLLDRHDEATEFATAAATDVVSRFDFRARTRRIEDLYESVIDRSRRRSAA
jgi:glycosyltransferase involved in cell wall biosynthesis